MIVKNWVHLIIITKKFLYCNEHKLPNMINIRKGYVLCKEHNISYSKDSYCKE